MTAGAGVGMRYSLTSRLAEARARTDELFNLLTPSAYYDRPIRERHRNIFYLGHLEAFDWNLFSGCGLGLRAFHPAFDKLFSFGIDPIGGGLPTDQPKDWPAVDEIRRYNTQARETLDSTLEKAAASGETLTGGFPLATLLSAAIEHRLMHAETFAYMLHQLPLKCLIAPPAPKPAVLELVKHQMVEIPAGETMLGLAGNGAADFGWDNEFEMHRVNVPAFSIDAYPVTNGDFLKFSQAGGYEHRDLWTQDAWQWITEQQIRHPAFWRQDGKGWLLRIMFAETPLPLEWPVYVSHAEASAYARWVGKSLPLEAEWHRAAYGAPEGHEIEDRMFPWGNETPAAALGNFDFKRWNPAPVNAHPRGASAFGVMDLLGNGWEWTSTVFAPFAGFKAYPFYPGYSANFFDGKHYVMKGGSPRTAACMLRRSFRNWFQPHYPYVYATFRCVVH
ncbi:MAG: SUMF1/EgtB/PvdO family nonheme iron enzyme [Terriglobia bacterium]